MAKKITVPAEEASTLASQSYYLQQVHIKRFRSIRDAEVSFQPGLNIIIGTNGAGKTNLVKSLGHGLQAPRNDFQGELNLALAGRQRIDVTYPKVSAVDPLSLPPLGLPGSQRPKVSVVVDGKEAVAEYFQQALLPLVGLLATTTHDIFFPRLVVVSHGLPAPYSFATVGESFSIHSGGASYEQDEQALFPQALSNGIADALMAASLSSKNLRLPTHAEVYTALAEVESFFLAELRPHLTHFTPIEDIRLTANYQVYTNSTQQQVVVKGVLFDFKITGDWLPFEALSSGTQRLFYLVSEVVGSFLSYSSTKARQLNHIDKIILIEEPELGIHPDQLHLLLNFLREQSTKHQIIITTHAPQVLDMLNNNELDRVTICELDENKGTQFRKLTAAQIATAQSFMDEQGLFLSDYWRYGNLESTQ